MIDWGLITGFNWDEGNGRKSAEKHGVGQKEAEQVFLDPRVLVLADTPHSGTESRFHALGIIATGRALQVSFTLRESRSKIRVISAGPMNRKERVLYEKEA